MDRQPPPFFNRGPAPVALLTFYALISLSLVFIDHRLKTVDFLRQALSVVVYPLQRAAHMPGAVLESAAGYVSGIQHFEEENTRLKREQINLLEANLRMDHLEAENERLRKLLALQGREKISGQVAHLLYVARDPFSRRVVVDKGIEHEVVLGQPAIDEEGVIGQVTRVFPFISEVTLITDKNQSIPVQILRNGLRSVAFGLGNGQMELRFLPTNADIEVGDVLVTSGLDDVFLPGLPVARVLKVERETSFSFAKIICEPLGGVERYSELMLLSLPAKPHLPAEVTAPKEEVPAVRRIKRKKQGE